MDRAKIIDSLILTILETEIVVVLFPIIEAIFVREEATLIELILSKYDDFYLAFLHKYLCLEFSNSGIGLFTNMLFIAIIAFS